MKKIKNFKLKMSMLIFVLILMVVQIGPFLVYADESELSFSYKKFTQPATNEYYNGKNLYFSQARVGQYVGYCLDYGLPLPTSSGGTVKYVRKLSPVATAVMKYGYPYYSASQLGVNSDEEAELATQLAVWGVVNSSNFDDSQKATKVLDMDNLKPVAGYEAYMTRVKAAAKRLINRAIADPYYSNPILYINPANAKMVVGSEYMIAGPYEVKATGFDVSSVKASLSGAPASAQITDKDGNVKTTVKNGENIYVKMSKTESGSELTINVSASGNTVIGKVYGTGNAGDGKQDYGIIVPSPVQLNDSTKLKWATLTGNVKINKVDQYGNIIPGVKFELRDMNNKVVSSGTTNSSGILEFKNIKIGKYKLVETQVPSNYIMAKEPYEFEITTGKTKEITFQNRKIAPGKIEITKVDQHGNTIAGCKFELKDANGKVIYTGTTDKNGYLGFDNLEQGKYYLQEVAAPEGYEMKKDAVELNVPNNKILTLKFPNRRINGGLKIIKVDENKVPLEGVKFEILNANKKVIDTIVTNKEGIAETTAKLTVGTYYYREIAAPNNIIIDTKEYQFKITGYDEVVIKNLVNNIKKGKLEIYKTTEGDKKPLAGVTFQILDSNKKVVETIVTNEKGIATTKQLPKGKYYYKETKVPEGIRLDSTEYEFTMDYQDVRKEVVNKYAVGTLKIIKVDENKVPLAGVTFEILDANKKVVDTIVTNKEGIAETTVKLTVGTYYYREIAAPNNIIIDTKEYQFRITKNDQVVIKNIVNNLKKGKLEIYKTTEGDNKPLAGVTFQIIDANKKIVDTVVTNEKGIATTKELPKGKYYYKEIKVPFGIKLDSTEYEFTMDYQDVRKEVVNKYAKSTLKIIKVDENDVPLKGVKFEIYDVNKKLVDTIVTDEKGIAQSKELDLGTYYYKEIEAPINVIIDTKMYKFELTKDGEVVIKNLVNNLKKGKLEIYKTTEGDNKPLAGVKFEILDANKKVVDTIETNAEGIATTKELPKGKYYYKEIKVPFGIKLDSTEYEFTMDYQNVRKEVVNKYAKSTLKILKVDENEIPVKGVKFEIYDVNKKLVDTIVTDEKGVAQSKELNLGTYYYKEVEAPDNVIMDTEMHKFELTKDGEVVIKNIVNKLVRGKLRIVKTTETGTPIKNVTFQILNEAKEVIETITTDENGIAETKPLKAGKYYYRETEAPVSVIADYTEYEFIVESNDQVIEKKVINELVKGSLKIIKTDDLKAPLANVKFEILDKDKNVIQIIVTDEKGIAVSQKLTIGKYYYREVEAPDNVVIDTKEYDFKIVEHEQVIEKEIENKRIEGKLIIYKLDKDTKQPLANVTFQVFNEAKEVIETITTDKDGVARLGGLLKGKYYFKEVEAPENYIMNTEEFSFEIVKDMQTVEATVYNEHLKLPVTGGFIGTDTLIVIIVAVVVTTGYVTVKLILNRKNAKHSN